MATSEMAPAYAPEDPTLPKPWTGLIDCSTGALYYWNQETNATQYEKPAALPPPSAMGPPLNSTPKLASIPMAHAQPPNDTTYQHELDQQMPQHQSSLQLHNHHTYHQANQPTQHYQNMQMNQMVPTQFTKTDEVQVPRYQHQQHGLPNDDPQLQQNGYDNPQLQQNGYDNPQPQQNGYDNPQPQQNGYPIETDLKRQVGDPVGFAAPSIQKQTSGATGDGRFPEPVPHFPQVADYSVRLEQQFRKPPSTGMGSAFSDMQQAVADASHWQQPLDGSTGKNQVGNAMSRPLMDQKMGFGDDQHGRGRNEHYSSSNKVRHMMPQQQPQHGAIPHAGNQQDIRSGSIPQPLTFTHPGGLNMGQEVAMPKFHDHASFPNMPQRGPSQKVFGSTDFTNNSDADAYCEHHEISVTGDSVYAPLMTFAAAGFAPEILRDIHAAGFSVPTPIQAQTWPIALQSRDIVAIAKTGSGKTLGYLIPAFLHIKQCRNNPQIGPTVVVLSPTRELATQIQEEAIKFGRSSRISCTCLYGGAPKGPQLRDIERGVDIVVATPGRLNDILEMKKINFCQVSFLVLDEADRMLDMGFEPQIRKIVSEIPPRRQTLMYTATWPQEVKKIAGDLLVNPVQVNIGKVDVLAANKSITQYVEVVLPMDKQRRLEQILRTQERGSKIIIFCSTKKLCDQLGRNMRNYGAAVIHGDKSQGERDHVLNQFRTGKSPILVATDVAARGLDVKDIRVVVNYDFPTGIEDYVHRIGRTGRAGATGVAYTFISDKDWKHASDIVKILEGANQQVPPQVREMAARGASSFSRGGRGTSRWDAGGGRGTRDDVSGRGDRWDSSGGGRGMRDSGGGRGMRDGGMGGGFGGRGRNDFASGGHGNRGRGFDRGSGGRGWQDREVGGRGRFDGPGRNMERRGRSRSRSPERVRTWGYNSSDDSRSRSRSRSRSYERPQRARRPSGFDTRPPGQEALLHGNLHAGDGPPGYSNGAGASATAPAPE